jgi:hypothetical protein
VRSPLQASQLKTITATTYFPAERLRNFDIFAYSVQVRWKSTDTTSSPSTYTPTPSPTPAVPISSDGLSAGAKAGIAVAVVVVFLGILKVPIGQKVRSGLKVPSLS